MFTRLGRFVVHHPWKVIAAWVVAAAAVIVRLREEAARGTDPRTAADRAIEHGGPSVAAAGLILVGTFSSLMLAGMALLGTRAWWPRRVKVSPPAEDRESALTASGAR